MIKSMIAWLERALSHLQEKATCFVYAHFGVGITPLISQPYIITSIRITDVNAKINQQHMKIHHKTFNWNKFS